jgi:lysophospholipase L1-like esterase
VAVTINSGALVEFAYTGPECSLVFDVKGFTQFPAIFVQTDRGTVSRTTLAANVSSVSVTPDLKGVGLCHQVRFWVAAHSLYQMPVAGKQWETLDGGCRFLGVKLENGELVPLPYGKEQIEFLGDSITQGLRLLYNGEEDDTGQQEPYVNWPQLTADQLSVKPVVTGFGGQGLSTPGTCGAPSANAAFPFIFKDVPWRSPVKPRVVVIYQGTNDGIPAPAFQDAYFTYLQTIRQAYPAALILAVCPHNVGRYAAAIQTAVTKMADARIAFLDYSSGVISTKETSDGCHLNRDGAVRLAARVTKDLQDRLGSGE